ncbi:T9SS type A sorting domain-containing protein [Paludibacteraceae bacterium OttesenSCG-928-F17]|nr:T9SS type A sorting domain-containing protein [Paludibacteraceae bacterium OttesenSCG-928-F17]
MKKTLLLTFLSIAFLCLNAQKQTITVFDQVLFYDSYNNLESLASEIAPVPDGVIRLSTSVCATKLSAEQLSAFGDSIEMEVVIKAACDNYDRLGHVHLALVPKGTEDYNRSVGDRYELGRFITPFMDKNKTPETVPYNYDISYLKHVFKDKDILDAYDFWMELEVSGVPYAANKEILGCASRNDVFYGSLRFHTSETATAEEGNVLIPLFNKQRFNNYKEGATDELFETKKTLNFSIEKNLQNVKLVLITSNHGAGTGGEEYNRRWHYVRFDDKLVLSYRPGRNSCEPFRKYNTQTNGIYNGIDEQGKLIKYKSPEHWQGFSNWCPGDVIDTHVVELGDLNEGQHTFVIDVPDAVFVGQDGNFPLSAYLLSTPERTDEDYLEVSTDSVLLYSDGVSKYVQIKSNTSWTVECEESWLAISPASEKDYSSLSFTANGKTNEIRNATVTVSNNDTTIEIKVTQDPRYITLKDTKIEMSVAGESKNININTNVYWEGLSNADWLTFTPNKAAGSKQVKITVAQNNGAPRIGSINFYYENHAKNIEVKAIKVVQAGSTTHLDTPSLQDQLLTIYPNPVKDILNIDTDIEPQKVRIFNSTGQKVYEASFTKSINISVLPTGIYWLSIIDGVNNPTQKIIKQ